MSKQAPIWSLAHFKPAQVASIVVGGMTFAGVILGALLTAWYTSTSRTRELDIELVKLSVSILREHPDPESKHKHVRDWAITTLDRFSPVKLSLEAQAELRGRRLEYYPVSSFDPRFGPVVPGTDMHDPISVLKAALSQVGNYRGPINNDDDEAFQQSVRDFQKSKNLQQTGNVDTPTFLALQAAAPDFFPSRRRGVWFSSN